jgi:hypothetical protein
MEEKHAQGVEAQPAPAAEKPFLAPPRYPGEGLSSTSTTSAPPVRRRRSVFTRIVLPLIAFAVIVGGLAWLTQNLRTVRPIKHPGSVAGPDDSLLKFDELKAVWETDKPDYARDTPDYAYAKEWELGTEGYYDFPFTNPTPAPVRLGLLDVSCGCSHAGVATLSAEELAAWKKDRKPEGLRWQAFTKDPVRGVTIPPHSGGVVRLGWNARQSNQKKNLQIRLWTETGGKRAADINLEAAIQMVAPIRCSPRIGNIGNLEPGGMARHEFWVWSSTRDHFELDARDKVPSPCYVYKITPLPPAEFAGLQKAFFTEHGIDTRIKAGYKLIVEVYEDRAGSQLDLGPFERTVPVIIDGNDPDEPLGPTIKGRVLGIIEFGSDRQGHVDLLPFPVNSVKKWHYPVRAPSGVKLIVESVPHFLEATLTAKESHNARGNWDLCLRLRSGVLAPGPVDNAVIVLRTDGMPPRRIRIPVVGTGTPPR